MNLSIIYPNINYQPHSTVTPKFTSGIRATSAVLGIPGTVTMFSGRMIQQNRLVLSLRKNFFSEALNSLKANNASKSPLENSQKLFTRQILFIGAGLTILSNVYLGYQFYKLSQSHKNLSHQVQSLNDQLSKLSQYVTYVGDIANVTSKITPDLNCRMYTIQWQLDQLNNYQTAEAYIKNQDRYKKLVQYIKSENILGTENARIRKELNEPYLLEEDMIDHCRAVDQVIEHLNIKKLNELYEDLIQDTTWSVNDLIYQIRQIQSESDEQHMSTKLSLKQLEIINIIIQKNYPENFELKRYLNFTKKQFERQVN